MKKKNKIMPKAKEKENDIFLNPDFVYVRTAKIVSMTDHLSVLTDNGPVDLMVDISADFTQVPEEFHEVFLNLITAKYTGKVSFSDNPFSKCHVTDQKKKWWSRVWNKIKG